MFYYLLAVTAMQAQRTVKVGKSGVMTSGVIHLPKALFEANAVCGANLLHTLPNLYSIP